VVLTLAGRLTLERFARLTMTTTFRRFFEHVIFQVGGEWGKRGRGRGWSMPGKGVR
jgi:hypothetical protein